MELILSLDRQFLLDLFYKLTLSLAQRQVVWVVGFQSGNARDLDTASPHVSKFRVSGHFLRASGQGTSIHVEESGWVT